MAAKDIFEKMGTKLMDGFLASTLSGLYISGHQELDAVEDFAAVITATISADYDHLKTDGENLNAFLGLADKVINTTAKRTVYMDSNIALTDGNNLARDGARVIPNLYEAINGLRLGEEVLAEQTDALISKIESISASHGPSTADGGIFIDVLRSNASPIENAEEYLAYAQLQHVGPSHVIRLRPADLKAAAEDGTFDIDAKNAASGVSAGVGDAKTFGFNIEADEISFTVTNRNASVEDAYVIANSNVTEDNFIMDVTDKGEGVASQGEASALQGGASAVYYWVPMEDRTVTSTTIGEGDEAKTTYSLMKNDHGKIFVKFDSTIAVYASHAVVNVESIELREKVTESLQIPSKMTYNLGAIIEAIQELNRRTMFMDIDMSFNGAMSYGDYNKKEVNAGHYAKVLDGLPAASNSSLAMHGETA